MSGMHSILNVRDRPTDAHHAVGGDSADIAAPLAVVFAIVADLELLPRWQPDVTVAEALQRDADGRATLIHAELVSRPPVRLRVSCQDPSAVTWVVAAGSERAFEGCWTLADLGDGRTRARYSPRTDLGRAHGRATMPARLRAYVAEHASKPARRSRSPRLS